MTDRQAGEYDEREADVKVCKKHIVEFCGDRPCDICQLRQRDQEHARPDWRGLALERIAIIHKERALLSELLQAATDGADKLEGVVIDDPLWGKLPRKARIAISQTLATLRSVVERARKVSK